MGYKNAYQAAEDIETYARTIRVRPYLARLICFRVTTVRALSRYSAAALTSRSASGVRTQQMASDENAMGPC